MLLKVAQLLFELRGFKFVTKLVVVLKNFYSHSKTYLTIDESEIDDNVFKSIYN